MGGPGSREEERLRKIAGAGRPGGSAEGTQGSIGVMRVGGGRESSDCKSVVLSDSLAPYDLKIN